jgi:ABC-type multidrug transport system fused ATPase/permease subunit
MLVVLAVGLATASDALVGVLVATALVPGTASGLDTLERLANSLPTGLAAARRVREMAESPAPLPEPAACSVPADGGDGTAPAEQTPAALLDAVDFYYPGADQPVLEDVSFTLERGGHVGLMGPTGSGKSTVARLLQRHQDPGAGRVVLHGADARVRGSVQVRRLVAVADQDPFLLEGTVAENLRLAVPEADESRMQDALDLACCELPLDRTVGRRGQSLSGGQRQRLALARTLLRLTDTPGGVANGVLVLDEATSHQEPQLQERIMENIGGIGSSTVTIAHRAGALRHTDLVVGLEEGRVCAVGPWTEVCRFPGVEPH